MKYGKEFKVGLVSLVILVSFIWVLNFIKGYNFFNPNDYYYAVYPTSGGLQTGRPVKINGVRVGIVSDISFFTGVGTASSEVYFDNFRLNYVTGGSFCAGALGSGETVTAIFSETPENSAANEALLKSGKWQR